MQGESAAAKRGAELRKPPPAYPLLYVSVFGIMATIHYKFFPKESVNMERRTFLCAAASSALAACSSSLFAQDRTRPRLQQAAERQQERVERRQERRGTRSPERIPIGVQLYSVRNAVTRDLAGSLEAIAKMGYDGVEFYGGNYFGKDIKDLRKMLDDNGLKCCGTHTGIAQFRGDQFERTAEIHQILGGKFMIVPGGIDAYLHDVGRSKELAEEFNRIAEKAKPLGLYLGYHAHGGDAKLIEGIPAWERFFDVANQDIVHQMDIGNYKDGGGDPYAMIEKFAGQSKSLHLKEAGQNRPIIGEGTVDWPRVFDLSESIGGVEWYVVEDEVGPDNLDRIEKCIIALRAMGK